MVSDGHKYLAPVEPTERETYELRGKPCHWSTLQELYVDELKDLFNAENQLLKALPAMAEASTEPKLKKAFQDHLSQTEGHVERLNEIFPVARREADRQGL